MACNDVEEPHCLDCCPNICCDRIFGSVPALQECENPCEEKCEPEVCVEEVSRKASPLLLEVEQPVDDGVPWKTSEIVRLDRPIKWRCVPEKEKKKAKVKVKDLGNPVGVSFGWFNINHPKLALKKDHLSMQAFATCLMAFGEIYITPEEEWDSNVLNRILVEGKEHLNSSIEAEKAKIKKEQAEKAEKATKESEKQVIEEVNVGKLSEDNVSKIFIICGNSMEAQISKPFVIGTLASTDPRIPDFYYGIVKFMRKYTYCLVTVAEQYYLIWKCAGLFFVYDCYGRNRKLQKRTKSGVTALISLRSLENVSYLIVNLSDLPDTEVFVIRKIKMMVVYACCIFDNEIERRVRQREFEIANDHHAILKGHLHLATSCFKENKNKFSLAVAMTALITSKIDSPSTWDSYCVDKVLMIAHKFYNKWTNCKHHIDLKITNIPTTIEIGKFAATISITQVDACGTWMLLPNYKKSEITAAIKKLFQKCTNLIVQVADRTYALMKRGNFYYLLDPYRHECRGSKKIVAFSYLHMCSTLNMLCCVLSNEVIEIFSPSPFYIHTVIITSIVDKKNLTAGNKPPCQCANVKQKDEVVSLNDSLGDITCKRELICVAEKYGFEPDDGNLDSPGLSQTQIPPDYDDLKASGDDEHGSEEDEDEDDDDDDDDDDDESSDGSDDGGGKKKRKKKGKGKGKGKEKKEKKEKKDKGKKKDKGDKDKKDKDKKDKDKKDKDKKDKDKKDKDKKDKGKDKKGKGDKDGKDGKDGADGDETGVGDGEGEGEEEMEEEKLVPEGCLPNSYPGYSCVPYNLVVAGSESGDYESLCNLLKTGYKCSDRILTMTPWGNYVAFKSKSAYLLYDGCTCNVNRFRHLDLTVGTAGLLCFWTMHDLLQYIIKGKGNKSKKRLNCEKKYLERVIDDICDKYCS